MFAHLIRVLSILMLGCSAAVLLYPQKQVLGLDLSNLHVQALVFALYLILRVLALVGRLRMDPMLQYRSGIWTFDARDLRRRVVRGTVELLVLVSALELGQEPLPHRTARVTDFAVNASVVLLVGAALLVVLTLLLKTAPGRRLVQYLFTLDA